jgi:hypothetical protein
MGWLFIVPLLVLPMLFYMVTAATHGALGVNAYLAEPAITVGMSGGGQWIITHGHMVTLLAIFCLFIEIVKSVRPSTMALIDNALSIGIFIICMVLFLLVPGYGTTEFFLIMLMALLDFMAGAVVMVFTARKTVEFDNH